MKRSFSFIVLLFALIIFASCAHQTRFVNPEYKNKKITKATLLLPQFENSNFIENEELFQELDITESKEEYYSLFIKTLEKCLKDKSTFQTIKYFSYNAPPEYQTRKLDINPNQSITFDLPPEPIQVNISGSNFILFFDDLLFSFSKKTKEATTSTRTYSVSGLSDKDTKLYAMKNYKYYITISSEYVLYDNTSGDLVSYGTVSVQEQFIPPTPIEDFVTRIIKNFTGKIFTKTIFQV